MMTMQKKRWRISRIFIGGGLLLLLAALSLTCYNLWAEYHAGVISQNAVQALEQQREQTEPPQPLYELYPEMDMPIQVIDGKRYIGTLELTTLDITLPVMNQWSYPNLRLAPSRYAGSVYSHNIIIAGHNYPSHFGGLKNLNIGDKLSFTDVDGNQFFYEVAELEVLDGTAIEDMVSGDWDMTLFTCTYGGQNRVTVRCTLQHSVPAAAQTI